MRDPLETIKGGFTWMKRSRTQGSVAKDRGSVGVELKKKNERNQTEHWDRFVVKFCAVFEPRTVRDVFGWIEWLERTEIERIRSVSEAGMGLGSSRGQF